MLMDLGVSSMQVGAANSSSQVNALLPLIDSAKVVAT
jgi:hypothetical protein